MPIVDVVLVHCGTPAKDIVLDEKIEQHRNDDVHASNFCKSSQLRKELGQGDTARLGQRFLHNVIERAKPLVNAHIHLHLEPGSSQNQGTAQKRPQQPAFIQKERSKHNGLRYKKTSNEFCIWTALPVCWHGSSRASERED